MSLTPTQGTVCVARITSNTISIRPYGPDAFGYVCSDGAAFLLRFLLGLSRFVEAVQCHSATPIFPERRPIAQASVPGPTVG
mmetsp:Transcript_36943/g.91921  ORF Transcript_36943/g.91921 Transcript_36943/m.91921 type:complete len:82 (-) Transcript_36943:723-968(-)